MTSRITLTALALAAAVAGLATPARATAFCEVLKTRDGFVALRDAPSAGGKLLRRVKTGEMVQIDGTRETGRGWTAVIYRSEDGKSEKAGWVSSRLIEKECG